MNKLSTLIRRENCFFTKDGQTLKTIQDLLDYLINCSEQDYAYHVNEGKNDFAAWVEGTLLFPDLAKDLRLTKNLVDARDALMEFLQALDYTNKWVPEEKTFHTINDYKLRNIQELYYYVNNCDDNSFYYHHNAQKKDFANWVSDVLIFPALASTIRSVETKVDAVRVLKDFLTKDNDYEKDPEYERYMKERLLNDKDKLLKDQWKTYSQDTNTTLPPPSFISPTSSTSPTNLFSDNSPDLIQKNVEISPAKSSEKVGAILIHPSEKVEETINLERKFDLTKEEEPEKDAAPTFDNAGFRQFTDEELEKFTKFAKPEIIVEADMKVEYLKTALQELKNMVRDMRRADKDPMVADLMLRTVDAKINYYALSKNVDDYNHVIRIMKDVQYEIEESANHKSYNIAEELLKDLKLQGIAMRKA